uniref:Uncharacterized protein n=1 Tax=Prymnesium polylepis TaxID=72548 RepID=A0A7S4J1U4_9EUKA|mmetsp:Transcript_38058/g.94974  ORF Transcript_38058/g.94974 Transcript_38058/m.94974 type:complete len:106 (+) Transcript_38058:238-555(+)
MRTAEFYVGNTRPYGANGQTLNPSPVDPYRPSPNDVCQYGPDYCNYPNGQPTELGECKCNTEGVYASSGRRGETTRHPSTRAERNKSFLLPAFILCGTSTATYIK